MQDGRDDRRCLGLTSLRRMSADHPGWRSIQVSLAGLVILLLFPLIGCGSRNHPAFTDRATEEGRAKRIRELRMKTEASPVDAQTWQQLGLELLKEGNSYYRGGDLVSWRRTERILDEALADFERALKLDPADSRLLALAGHAYLTKFRLDPFIRDTVGLNTAILLLEHAVRLNPESVDVLVDLGIAWTPTWSWSGDESKARSYLDKAMVLAPDNGMVHYAWARLVEVDGRGFDAMASLRKAFDLGLSDEVTYFLLANQYEHLYYRIMNGDDESTSGASSLLMKAVAEVRLMFYRLYSPFPQMFKTGVFRQADALGLRNTNFYRELGNLYAGLGRKEKGFGFYVRAFELDSVTSNPYFWYEWQYPDSIWLPRFMKLIPPGSYYGCLVAAEKHGMRRPIDSLAMHHMIQAAIALQPTYGAAYVLWGHLFVRAGDSVKARECFEKALPLEFHSAESMFAAADDLWAEGDFDLALRYYKRILDLDLAPRVYVLRSIGSAYEAKGDLRSAYATYLEIDRLYPSLIRTSWWGHETTWQISAAYADRGNYDKAIDLLRQSVGTPLVRRLTWYYLSSTDDALTYERIGAMYSKKGDWNRAIASYLKALEIEKDHAPAYYALGNEYLRHGMREKAIENYRHALRLGIVKAQADLAKLGVTEKVGG